MVAYNYYEPPKEDAELVLKLILALEKMDYKTFVAEVGPGLQKGRFDALVSRLSPKLKGGHEGLYFGALSQRGYHVTLWKVSFKEKSDDLLVKLGVKGKVTKFELQSY